MERGLVAVVERGWRGIGSCGVVSSCGRMCETVLGKVGREDQLVHWGSEAWSARFRTGKVHCGSVCSVKRPSMDNLLELVRKLSP